MGYKLFIYTKCSPTSTKQYQRINIQSPRAARAWPSFTGGVDFLSQLLFDLVGASRPELHAFECVKMI